MKITTAKSTTMKATPAKILHLDDKIRNAIGTIMDTHGTFKAECDGKRPYTENIPVWTLLRERVLDMKAELDDLLGSMDYLMGQDGDID